MSRATRGARNGRIDVIRGVSILLVLVHHFTIAYTLDDTILARLFGWHAVRAIARNGNYGVTMFFVVSGYLITSNACRRWPDLARIDALAFYGLRVARIVPCLLLLLAIADMLAQGNMPVFRNHAPTGTPVAFWIVNLAALTFWMNVLIGTHGWVNFLLGVLWSLSVEEVFYLAFPLLCLVLRRDSRLLACWAAIIVIGPVYRAAHQGDEGGFLYAYFACFDGIAIGCCAALLANRISLRGVASKIVPGLAAIAMACLYLCAPIGQTNVLGVTAMALGTATLLLAAHDRPRRQDGNSRLLAGVEWFGRRSYELYLFHLVVLGAMRTLFLPGATKGDEKLLLLAAFLLLSAALGAGIAHGFSEPLNRRIRRWLAPGAATVAA